jgi:hypothetical protein
MPKLTKRIVDAAQVRATEYFIWDDDIPGVNQRRVNQRRTGTRFQRAIGTHTSG